jgi:hypothetical protein
MGGEYGGHYYGGVPRVGGRDTLKSFFLPYKNNAPFCMDGMDMFKCAFGGQSDGVFYFTFLSGGRERLGGVRDGTGSPMKQDWEMEN